MKTAIDIVTQGLNAIMDEIRSQKNIGETFPQNMQCFDDWLEQMDELVKYAGEFSIAYESIVATLEQFPFAISGPTAVRLIEVGLIMKYKTERDCDVIFDGRSA